jgi:hypothetical protein
MFTTHSAESEHPARASVHTFRAMRGIPEKRPFRLLTRRVIDIGRPCRDESESAVPSRDEDPIAITNHWVTSR